MKQRLPNGLVQIPKRGTVTTVGLTCNDALTIATNDEILQELINIAHSPLSRCTKEELLTELVKRGYEFNIPVNPLSSD